MSRNATAQLVAPPLPDLGGGAEVLIIEARLAHFDATQGASREEEHNLCVLALVDPDDSIRRVLRVQVACYIGAVARIESLAGPNWEKRLVELLDGIEPAFLDLVIALPSASRAALSQLTTAIDALRGSDRHQLCAALIVIEQSMRWMGEVHDFRFVTAEGMTAQEGAVWLHAGIAQLSAPLMVECLTREDFDGVFGFVPQPARIFLTDAERLDGLVRRTLNPDGPAAAQRAGALFLDGVGLREYGSAVRVLRSAGVDSPVVLAPGGLTASLASGTAARCVLVVPASEGSRQQRSM